MLSILWVWQMVEFNHSLFHCAIEGNAFVGEFSLDYVFEKVTHGDKVETPFGCV